jgi:hypothetical protein
MSRRRSSRSWPADADERSPSKRHRRRRSSRFARAQNPMNPEAIQTRLLNDDNRDIFLGSLKGLLARSRQACQQCSDVSNQYNALRHLFPTLWRYRSMGPGLINLVPMKRKLRQALFGIVIGSLRR